MKHFLLNSSASVCLKAQKQYRLSGLERDLKLSFPHPVVTPHRYPADPNPTPRIGRLVKMQIEFFSLALVLRTLQQLNRNDIPVATKNKSPAGQMTDLNYFKRLIGIRGCCCPPGHPRVG